MMLKSAKAVCKSMPLLFLSGINGGIQERSVRKALGEASKATYNTNQQIAGDVAVTLKAVRNRSGSKEV